MKAIKSRGTILLAAGGTGGHVYPASALAGALKADGYDVHLATDKRGLAFVEKIETMRTHKLAAATIFGQSLIALPMRLLTLLYSMVQAFILIVRLRPVIIGGFGGYPSFTPIMMGLLLRQKIFVHEQNAVMGRVNRLAAWLGAHVATSFGDTLHVPQNAQYRLCKTGNPLRPQVLAAARGGYRFIAPNRPLDVLIYGGSQGATIFDQIVPSALNLLDDGLKRRLRVVQQVRRNNISKLLRDYSDMGVYVELRDFFDDLPSRMRRAHLIICRGGAATISELAALGAPAIIVPFAGSLDQDQARNAKKLHANGGCIVIAQDQLNVETLAKKLADLLTYNEKLRTISANALGFAELNATEKLMRYVLCLAENRKIDIEHPFEREQEKQEVAQ